MTTQLAEANVETLEGGYVSRPATLVDLEGAVAVFNACSRQLVGSNEFDVDTYRLEWQIPGLNLETDIRVITAADGQIVACMEAWDLIANHIRVNLYGRVHPDHQGRGLGTALLRWGEMRARQAVKRAPVDARVTAQIGALDQDGAAMQLFEKAGFTLTRRSWRMQADLGSPLPAPEWPDGIAVRTLRFGIDDRAAVQCTRD